MSLPVSPSWDSKALFSHWTLEPLRPIPLTPNFSDHEESGPPAYCEADRHHRRGAHLDHNGIVFPRGGELKVVAEEPHTRAGSQLSGAMRSGEALNSQLPAFCTQLKQPRDH